MRRPHLGIVLVSMSAACGASTRQASSAGTQVSVDRVEDDCSPAGAWALAYDTDLSDCGAEQVGGRGREQKFDVVRKGSAYLVVDEDGDHEAAIETATRKGHCEAAIGWTVLDQPAAGAASAQQRFELQLRWTDRASAEGDGLYSVIPAGEGPVAERPATCSVSFLVRAPDGPGE